MLLTSSMFVVELGGTGHGFYEYDFVNVDQDVYVLESEELDALGVVLAEYLSLALLDENVECLE